MLKLHLKKLQVLNFIVHQLVHYHNNLIVVYDSPFVKTNENCLISFYKMKLKFLLKIYTNYLLFKSFHSLDNILVISKGLEFG